MSNITNIRVAEPVQGLLPELLTAEWTKPQGEWLQCGGCGYNGLVQFYVYDTGSNPFAPVCNCPLPAVLEA